MNYFGIMEHYGLAPDSLKKLMKLAGYENFKTRKFTSGELAHLTRLIGQPNVSYSVGGGRDKWYVVEIEYYPSIGAAVPGKKHTGYISYFGAQDAANELAELADIERVRCGFN